MIHQIWHKIIINTFIKLIRFFFWWNFLILFWIRFETFNYYITRQSNNRQQHNKKYYQNDLCSIITFRIHYQNNFLFKLTKSFSYLFNKCRLRIWYNFILTLSPPFFHKVINFLIISRTFKFIHQSLSHHIQIRIWLNSQLWT